MSDSKGVNLGSRGAGATKQREAGQTPNMPKSLSSKGYVVWFYDHGEYLGLAWNESAAEIERAHVANADHAIYFETFAQAAVARDKYISPCRVLHSRGPGKRPTLMG
ncbi:hypothetical protein [Pandoraea bronchicola]|uniref:Uncharacterized protein n=1 Tax=Pandoraea bronchicola TaxID=2508287 RepID=A0A5E5BSV4_9BURK|nr:hypothetical protein [Pandoraea bronchicola]VVE88155.1 hypothetical protein PBR20603_02104 [Pandoraea bronchicola]